MFDQKLKLIDSTQEALQYFTSTGVTFAATDDSMSATGIGSGLSAGDEILVSGSSQSANNTYWTIATVAADKITIDGAITDDNAGETITVTQVYRGDFQVVDHYAKLIASVYCNGNANLYIDFSGDGTNTDYTCTTSITGGTGAITTTEVCMKYARLRLATNAADQTTVRCYLYGRTES